MPCCYQISICIFEEFYKTNGNNLVLCNSISAANSTANGTCFGLCNFLQVRADLFGYRSSSVCASACILLHSKSVSLVAMLFAWHLDAYCSVLLDNTNILAQVCQARELVAILASPAIRTN